MGDLVGVDGGPSGRGEYYRGRDSREKHGREARGHTQLMRRCDSHGCVDIPLMTFEMAMEGEELQPAGGSCSLHRLIKLRMSLAFDFGDGLVGRVSLRRSYPRGHWL